MLQLFKKDLYINRGYFITIVLIVPIALYFDLDLYMFIGIFSVLFMMNEVLESRSPGVARFLVSLPIARKSIMIEKYLLFLLFFLFIHGYAWVIIGVLSTYFGTVSFQLGPSLFGLFTASFIIPIMIKVNNWGRITMIFVCSLLVGIFHFLYLIIVDNSLSISLAIPILAVSLVVYVLSLLVSLKLYRLFDVAGT